MERWRKKNKRLLIEPHPSAPPAKEAKALARKRWEDVQNVFNAELEKIIAGVDMPISRSTAAVRDGDPSGILMVMTCSDAEQADDEEKKDRRKKGKRNRQVESHICVCAICMWVGVWWVKYIASKYC